MKCWKVPNMWKDGECCIIGGGSSIIEQFDIPSELVERVRKGESSMSDYSPYFAPIHKKHVIGINMAYKLGNWIDIILFGDHGNFFLPNLKQLFDFPNLIVSCNPKTKDFNWVKWLARDRKPYGICENRHKIVWNQNTGAAGINLAIHTGVKRILLFGFDMYINEGNQHFHNEYLRKRKRGRVKTSKGIEKDFQRHLKAFPAIAKEAKKLKIEILNINPKSRISDFQKMNLKDVL
jgi:hypothetical protein